VSSAEALSNGEVTQMPHSNHSEKINRFENIDCWYLIFWVLRPSQCSHEYSISVEITVLTEMLYFWQLWSWSQSSKKYHVSESL